MKLLIFDLDFTLVNTTTCQDYLKTRAGREAIVEKLDSGEVVTELYFPDTVEYVNSLIAKVAQKETDVLPIIVSDSPKAYCEKIVELHGFKIPNALIFAAAHKPCVDYDALLAHLDTLDLKKYFNNTEVTEALVIGDSAKDVFFGHEISMPSIWALWGFNRSDYTFKVDTCKPTVSVNNLAELKVEVAKFETDGATAFDYQKPDFQKIFNIKTVDLTDFNEHQVDDIGYARYYVPEALELENTEHVDGYFEVNWMLKKAKDVPKDDLWKNRSQRFFKQSGEFTNYNKKLMSRAGAYKYRFNDWLKEKKIQGKVLLVPVPSSVPVECNKTYTVKLIAEWWTEWVNELNPDCELIHYDLLVERFNPKLPTHAKGGQRKIEDQLTTMGFINKMYEELPDDISAVVFLDDVTTSGHSINAMATIFRELNVVSEDVPLYGYVWFKTHHPAPDFDIMELIAKADKVTEEV